MKYILILKKTSKELYDRFVFQVMIPYMEHNHIITEVDILHHQLGILKI